MTIDSVSQTKINLLANKLLTSDEDKFITKNELFTFISENNTEILSLNLKKDDVQNAMIKALDSSYVADKEIEEEDNSDFAHVYNNIKDKILRLQAKLDNYNLLSEQLISDQTSTYNMLKEEENKYTELQQTLKQESRAYDKIIERIETTTKNLEADIARKQQEMAYEAMSNYNPEQDGEWNEYVNKYMANKNITSQFLGMLVSLTNREEFLQSSMDVLGSKLSEQSKVVNDLAKNYADILEGIENNDSLIASTTTQIDSAKIELSNSFLSIISQKEAGVIENKNINLSEKLEDGSARYIFAKGQTDGEYHVYDMKEGVSLTRKYLGEKNEHYDEKTKTTIGDDYIKDFDVDAKDNKTKYFYLDYNTMETSSASYKTESPLSFDLNGDGVKTSDNLVKYDIDADGVLDTINDSADAVLVFDKNHDGVSGANGSETFGNNTDLDGDGIADGYKDGFEALKALAKKEGLVNGTTDNVLDADDIKVLEEKWGFGIKAGYNGATSKLTDAGISEIKLANTNETIVEKDFDDRGNQLMHQMGATFKVNDEVREYADIWHKKQDASQAKINDNGFEYEKYTSSISADLSKAVSTINTSKISAGSATSQANAMMEKAKDTTNIFMQLMSVSSEKKAESEKVKKQKAQEKEDKKAEKEQKEQKIQEAKEAKKAKEAQAQEEKEAKAREKQEALQKLKEAKEAQEAKKNDEINAQTEDKKEENKEKEQDKKKDKK